MLLLLPTMFGEPKAIVYTPAVLLAALMNQNFMALTPPIVLNVVLVVKYQENDAIKDSNAMFSKNLLKFFRQFSSIALLNFWTTASANLFKQLHQNHRRWSAEHMMYEALRYVEHFTVVANSLHSSHDYV